MKDELRNSFILHYFSFEHILIVEAAIGKYLPEHAVVHHLDEDGTNNVNNNLVLCQDDPYHKLIHVRMRQRKREVTP